MSSLGRSWMPVPSWAWCAKGGWVMFSEFFKFSWSSSTIDTTHSSTLAHPTFVHLHYWDKPLVPVVKVDLSTNLDIATRRGGMEATWKHFNIFRKGFSLRWRYKQSWYCRDLSYQHLTSSGKEPTTIVHVWLMFSGQANWVWERYIASFEKKKALEGIQDGGVPFLKDMQ